MGDEEDRKLFVGGLPQECSQDDLQAWHPVMLMRHFCVINFDILLFVLIIFIIISIMMMFPQEYFGKWGELESVKLKMDPMTGELE